MAGLAVGVAGALLIGAIGIYGVVSYLVGRRRREFGIRLAVGARPREIAALILRRCLWITGAGAVAGILLAVLVTRLMRRLASQAPR